MEAEVALLRGAMTDIEAEKTADFEFYRGRLEGKDAVLLRCGIGKVNAAVGCALLIEKYEPHLVINTGSAGGVDPSLRFGDAIISLGSLYHDADVTGFGYPLGQIPGMPLIFETPEELVRLAEQAVDQLCAEGKLPADFHHVRGIIGSADIFMHEKRRLDTLRASFPQVSAVEMEGAAVAHTCRIFGVSALIIRAVSDIAGAESPMTFDQFLPIASKHSSEIVRRIIKNLPALPGGK
jgi:adenosylhomocysteine nucleosidase